MCGQARSAGRRPRRPPPAGVVGRLHRGRAARSPAPPTRPPLGPAARPDLGPLPGRVPRQRRGLDAARGGARRHRHRRRLQPRGPRRAAAHHRPDQLASGRETKGPTGAAAARGTSVTRSQPNRCDSGTPAAVPLSHRVGTGQHGPGQRVGKRSLLRHQVLGLCGAALLASATSARCWVDLAAGDPGHGHASGQATCFIADRARGSRHHRWSSPGRLSTFDQTSVMSAATGGRSVHD